MTRRLLAPVFVLAMTVAPAQARAGEPTVEDGNDAQDLYSAGRESYRLGLYGRALEQFERSFARKPSPNTRLYLARTLRELGRWSEAAEQYRATIREADERGGRYVETREAADMELRDVLVRIERGDASPKSDRASEKPNPDATKPAPPPAAPPPSGGGPTTLTWVSGGVAVAGLTSFAVFYGLAGDRYGYLEDNCTRTRDAACDSARTTGQTEELVSYVSLGIAAVAATIAVVSLVIRPSSPDRAARAMGPWRFAF